MRYIQDGSKPARDGAATKARAGLDPAHMLFDNRPLVPAAGYDFAADRLGCTPELLARNRHLVVAGAAAEESHAADAYSDLRVITQSYQSLLGEIRRPQHQQSLLPVSPIAVSVWAVIATPVCFK